MLTIVIDTNILIDAWKDDYSYPRLIMDEVMSGNIRAVASPKILRENQLILNRLVNNPEHYQMVNKFFNYIDVIPVYKRVNVVKYDRDDNKFFACAEEAKADYIISNDSHLWEIGEYKGTKVMTPENFWLQYKKQNDIDGKKQWKNWMQNIIE